MCSFQSQGRDSQIIIVIHESAQTNKITMAIVGLEHQLDQDG